MFLKENMIYFKQNLIYLLEQNNINKNQLAIKLNITRQSINDYINKNKLPSIETLIKLRKIFNISVDDLLLKDLSKE